MTTESDRELLDLAAKAAGLDVRWYANDCLQVADKCNGFAGKWNPLTDDGDALRLAVKLGIEVIPGMAHWGPVTYTNYPNKRGLNGPSETHGSDPMAATRRAIVRAAAAIARATHKEGA